MSSAPAVALLTLLASTIVPWLKGANYARFTAAWSCHTSRCHFVLDNQTDFDIILTILNIYSHIRLTSEAAMVKRKNPKIHKTKEICDRFDISRGTLFRWETEGLLTGVGRDWRGWMVNSDSNIREIEKIIRSKNA